MTLVIFIAIGSFSMQFYILRQAIAVSIFLVAFHYIEDRKFWKYLIAILIAALFHKTAFVLLALYPAVNVPPSKYKNAAIIVITVIVFILGPQISNTLLSNFYSEYTNIASSGDGISLLVLYIVLGAVYMGISYKLQIQESKSIKGLMGFALVLQFFATQNDMFRRIAVYGSDSFSILIPNTISKLRPKDRMLTTLIIIVACIGFILLSDTFGGYSIMKL